MSVESDHWLVLDICILTKNKSLFNSRTFFHQPLYSMGYLKQRQWKKITHHDISCFFPNIYIMDGILYLGKNILCTRFGVMLQLLGVKFIFKSLCPRGHDKTELTQLHSAKYFARCIYLFTSTFRMGLCT